MERYSNSTREVAQDGRRGALMLSVSIQHPDAESFIDAKMESGKVTGANVSVKISDEFMRAALENRPYKQQYPIDSDEPHMKWKLMPMPCGKKLCITPGNLPNPVYYSGTPSSENLFRIAMQI